MHTAPKHGLHVSLYGGGIRQTNVITVTYEELLCSILILRWVWESEVLKSRSQKQERQHH